MYSQDKKSKAKQCNINKTYLKKNRIKREVLYVGGPPKKAKLSKVPYYSKN